MASWEPERIGERTLLLPTGVNVGLWEDDEGAVLIDSGSDKEAGRQIRQALERRGTTLRMIVNTHSNADHIGGNAYLQNQTRCHVAATRREAAFISDPSLEPAFLWGAAPPRELQGKFLQAAPSTVDILIPDSGPVPGTPLGVIPTPGHFVQMIGILTPDRVLFAGDALFGEEVLAKHPVFFLHDVGAHLETLKSLEEVSADCLVPGHGRPVREVGPLVAANRAALQRTADAIRAFCSRPASFEEILGELCRVFSIEMSFAQYVLVGGTLRAYLAWLAGTGALEPHFEPGRMLWATP
jgi:glyoxylase-like metal-dependent hydrolase (beta-lactamase superfamily II)